MGLGPSDLQLTVSLEEEPEIDDDHTDHVSVGIEVDGFRDFDELDDVAEFDFSGLVLSDTIWQHLGKPEKFRPFKPGYRWRPFVRGV